MDVCAVVSISVEKESAMAYLKIFAGIALVVSLLWVIDKPGYDSWLAVVVSLSAFIALFVTDSKKRGISRQHQVVSKSALGVQAGGDVNIGTISRDKHVE